MTTLTFLLALTAFLIGAGGSSMSVVAAARKRVRDWFAETHSINFELRRHFFRRFFDSELISDPAQAKVVAGGVLAIVISLVLVYAQAYFHKYSHLNGLDDPGPYRRAASADILFVLTLAMVLVALFTTLQWPSLFPGLSDYLALAGLPARMRQIFIAKFTALLAFASMMIAGTSLLPSIVLPCTMDGRYGGRLVLQVPGIFGSGCLAGLFVFLSLVTVQGVLLNLLPTRLFQRVSLAVQGVLLAVLLCSLPLVFSIPNLHPYMELRPAWASFVPPLWFLGLDQMIAGHGGPFAAHLAMLAVASVAAAAGAAILAYLWSYRRHRTRVIESAGTVETTPRTREWIAQLAERLIPDLRSLAVFGFIAKSLARSRQHRLILTAFGAIALAVISEGFAGLFLQSGGFRGISIHSAGLRRAVIAIPLALSLFTLAGLRYLFRLPVELRANWVFRVHEPGQAAPLLAGAERFIIYWGVAPVAALTLPGEVAVLGLLQGLLASLACAFASLALMELLLFSLERIPFTSSYFPGKDPPIVTLIKYAVASIFYVGAMSSLIHLALGKPVGTLVLLFLLATAWLRARSVRLNVRQVERLRFEELAEPAVMLLSIERD